MSHQIGVIGLFSIALLANVWIQLSPSGTGLTHLYEDNGDANLDNCNCVTFNRAWLDMSLLPNFTFSHEPFTRPEQMVCCNGQQLESLSNLSLSDLNQLVRTEEVHLRAVGDPLLLLGKVAVLHLSHYYLDHPNDTLEHLDCRMKRFYLRESSVNVDLLDQLATHCLQLQVMHLERVWPNLIPQPTSESTMTRQFNVLTRYFPSDQLLIVNLIGCQILTLSGIDLLWNATNLRMISLSRNHLTMLENARFFPSKAPNLWLLDLSYNKLRSISMDWLFPETLRVLKLDHNLFKVVQFDPFKNVWSNLNEFWINANNFDCTMMIQSEEWMEAIANQAELVAVDSWVCYHHNGTKRMRTRQLPDLVRNNLTDAILYQ